MNFEDKVKQLFDEHEVLLSRRNEPQEKENGIITRYKHPILTAAHTPVFWRYDLDEKTNPYLMERIGMNATLNSGAIKWNGKYVLVVRVEGADRKSFFAVAESPNGIDNFRFWDYPVTMPEDVIPATNIYDMRLTGARRRLDIRHFLCRTPRPLRSGRAICHRLPPPPPSPVPRT